MSNIIDVILNVNSNIKYNNIVEQEKKVAIADLINSHEFNLKSGFNDIILKMHIDDGELAFDILNEDKVSLETFHVGLSAFKDIIKDYFIITESYVDAVSSGDMKRVESVDMGRRGLHNEGAQMLQEAILEFVEVNQETARRLFTLLCVLHIRVY